MTPTQEYSYIIVGGGLQGCLLAHALAYHRPEDNGVVVERADRLCGNHTWSLHESDVPPSAWPWFGRLIAHRWPAYRVRFPGFTRRVTLPYATIPSDTLRTATEALQSLGQRDAQHARPDGTPPAGAVTLRFGEQCEVESATAVRLSSGERLEARLVFDCRGAAAGETNRPGGGYQTFLGEEIATRRPWPADEPTVMDVAEDQQQGFEFLYELPVGRNRVLLEYTRFADTPALDRGRAADRIRDRIAEAGVGVERVVRTETGCLPMPFERGRAAPRPSGAIRGGYAGDWFHAATGYSLPLAIRFAETAARCDPSDVAWHVEALARQDRYRRGFSRLLNRLLFRLVSPRRRYEVFRRFYRVLPEERIARFYAHRFTALDAVRIVVGRPPGGLAPLRFARSLFSKTRPALP